MNLPKNIPVFPLSNFIIFPKTTVPLNIFEPRYIDMINDSMKSDKLIGIIQPKSYIKKDKLSELTLTTNGSQLEKYAEQLFDHGVRRINVSIDTLKPKLFKFLTRRGDLDQVLKGIDKALEVGLKVKINTVALKETNEFELNDILKWLEERN